MQSPHSTVIGQAVPAMNPGQGSWEGGSHHSYPSVREGAI